MLGDILVVQPPFIFPAPTNHTGTNRSGDPASAEEMKESSTYFLGVALCLLTAAACALANVVNVSVMKNNARITTDHLMLTSGIFSILLSLLSTPFLPNRLITDITSLPLTSAASLAVSAVMTLLAYWFITLAVTRTKSPTLISMLRSTEIVLSLGTEALWWGEPPGWLSVSGSLLVTSICSR